MEHGQKGTAMLFPARPSASAAVVSGGTAAPVAVDFAPAGFARRARHRIHGVPLSSPYYRSQDRFGPFAKARPYTKSADFVPIRKRARLLLRPPRARSDLPARKVHSPALSTRSRPSTHIAVDRNARSGSARRLALVSDAETSLRWVAVEGNGIWLSRRCGVCFFPASLLRATSPHEIGMYSSARRGLFGWANASVLRSHGACSLAPLLRSGNAPLSERGPTTGEASGETSQISLRMWRRHRHRDQDRI